MTELQHQSPCYPNVPRIGKYNELGICAGQPPALQLLFQEPVQDPITAKMDEEPGGADARVSRPLGRGEEIIFLKVNTRQEL